MKICIIAEGSYPYITGGVSSWIQMLMNNIPEHEFIIYSIGAEKKLKGKFSYEIPNNVIKVHETFLDSYLSYNGHYSKNFNISKHDVDNIKALITGNEINWTALFDLLHSSEDFNILNFFMSKTFFDIITLAYEESFPFIPFTEFFWAVRSMLLPLFLLLKEDVPEADLYHSVSTGYAGVIGALASHLKKKPFILTEHGIYTREREEEIIKSNWVKGYFKDMWINFFYNLSRCSYNKADKVITLFNKNKEIEMELGCREDKISIIPNGVNVNNFNNIDIKKSTDKCINIGAVLRVVPIKDLKTMIQSFSIVKEEIPNSKLFIMGPTDEDDDYFKECTELVTGLNVTDVIFTGKINVKDYLGKMDILLLSSISEGQPLSILEALACSKPFVATDVGSCKELLYGVNDNYGKAGFVVPVMNYEKMAEAIIKLCKDESLRISMGQNGLNRTLNLYTLDSFINNYKTLYNNYKDVTLWQE